MEDEAGFPKVLCFDLFFIVDNSDRDFDKYIEEIKIQIKDFLQKERDTQKRRSREDRQRLE